MVIFGTCTGLHCSRKASQKGGVAIPEYVVSAILQWNVSWFAVAGADSLAQVTCQLSGFELESSTFLERKHIQNESQCLFNIDLSAEL